MTENILFRTKIGSHVWGMNHKGSDTDVFEAYVAPTEDILKGVADIKSKFIQKDGVDIARHEVGKIVDQLLKGNINFIIGVKSPIIERDSLELFQLSRIVKETIAKNCYYSIHGLAVHNYKKYIESGTDPSERRCNKILRVLKFGQRILDGEGIAFKKVEKGTPDKIEEGIWILDRAFKTSSLPNKPTEAPFRDWLYMVRTDFPLQKTLDKESKEIVPRKKFSQSGIKEQEQTIECT